MEAVIARGIQLLIALGGAYLLALWFALIVWTFQDIQARSRSVIAQIFSTLVVVLFFVPGVLIYMILRPRDTLDDAFQRSLEEEYLLQDLEELPLCPNCQHYVEEQFVFCPHCRTELRQDCVACGRLIDLRWEICPYCGEDQYSDEEPGYLPDEWERAEPESVSRLLSQARDRLSTRRSRAPLSTSSSATEMTAPIEWEPAQPLESDEWERRPEQPVYRSNGSTARSAEWDGVDGDDAFERTDELPAETIQPPR